MNYRHQCKGADRSRNSAISFPPGEMDRSFSYAVFLFGTIATPCNVVNALSGPPGGSRVAPPYAPYRRGVRPMDHGTATDWKMTFFPGRGRGKLPLGIAGRTPWELTSWSPRLGQAEIPSCQGARVTTIRPESASPPRCSESTSRATPMGRTDQQLRTPRVRITGA
jgi:hypothetical protein